MVLDAAELRLQWWVKQGGLKSIMDLLELTKKLQYEIVLTTYTFNVKQGCLESGSCSHLIHSLLLPWY